MNSYFVPIAIVALIVLWAVIGIGSLLLDAFLNIEDE